MWFLPTSLLRFFTEVLDRLAWATASGAVDAVRYRPAQTTLALACAANGEAPVGNWLADVRGRPLLQEVAEWPHVLLRRAADGGERLFGPGASTLIRWYGGAVASLVDGLSASSLRGALPAGGHPITLVPHPHALAVLAVDLRGFSRLTRELQDTQYLADLVGEYLTTLTRIVERHHGVVFQYTGDGLLAVFLPELSRRDPGAMVEHLVQEVVPELHAGFDTLHAGWRAEWRREDRTVPQIGLGSGLSFGTVTLGYLGPSGKKHVGVLGEPVNVAAFLCSQAAASMLLVDQASFERTGAEMPSGTRRRLRSRKAHQRIGVIAVDCRRWPRVFDV